MFILPECFLTVKIVNTLFLRIFFILFVTLFLSSDVDECNTAGHSCVSLATCYNTEGGYNCTCKTGFFGDGITSCVGKEHH